MRVLCCLDGSNVEQLHQADFTMLRIDTLTIRLIYVIDSGPHSEIERQRERFLRSPRLTPHRHQQVQQAEIAAAQDILAAAGRYFSNAELLREEGRPERTIVNYAAEWVAHLIVINSRTPQSARPPLGPKSVGHVARFVLDHAPCPVLLVRTPINAPS